MFQVADGEQGDWRPGDVNEDKEDPSFVRVESARAINILSPGLSSLILLVF